jgi:IclR family transcriptional regulator, pca regulon regulatory protein
MSPPGKIGVPSHEPPRDSRFSQSLERGLAVLRCFTPKRPELGISEIADELEMSKSTVHRYAVTLVSLGYLEQLNPSHKYRLGLRVADLGMSAMNATGLKEHAHPSLQELRQTSGYTVGLAVLDGAEIRYLDRLPSFRREQAKIDLNLRPGSTLPAHRTALGKVLLAHLPEDELRRRIEGIGDLGGDAKRTIASRDALLSQLARVREAGLAVSDGEHAPMLLSIAVPVRNDVGDVVAAIDITAPSSTISPDQLVDAFRPHLLATAARISARLGFRRDDER